MDINDLLSLHSGILDDLEHLVTPVADALVSPEEAADRKVAPVVEFDLVVAKREGGSRPR